MFYIKNAGVAITSTTNQFKYNYVANKGGVFYLENSVLIDAGSTFEYNAALYGSIIYCKDCAFTFNGGALNY